MRSRHFISIYNPSTLNFTLYTYVNFRSPNNCLALSDHKILIAPPNYYVNFLKNDDLKETRQYLTNQILYYFPKSPCIFILSLLEAFVKFWILSLFLFFISKAGLKNPHLNDNIQSSTLFANKLCVNRTYVIECILYNKFEK